MNLNIFFDVLFEDCIRLKATLSRSKLQMYRGNIYFSKKIYLENAFAYRKEK